MLFFWNSPGRMPVMSDFLVRYQTTQDNGRVICAQFSNNLLTAPVTPYYYKNRLSSNVSCFLQRVFIKNISAYK